MASTGKRLRLLLAAGLAPCLQRRSASKKADKRDQFSNCSAEEGSKARRDDPANGKGSTKKSNEGNTRQSKSELGDNKITEQMSVSPVHLLFQLTSNSSGIEEEPDSRFSFLSLLREIRDLVYESLTPDRDIQTTTAEGQAEIKWSRELLPLFQICRQIRREALPCMTAYCQFYTYYDWSRIYGDNFTADDRRWYSSNIRGLRSLRFIFNPICFYRIDPKVDHLSRFLQPLCGPGMLQRIYLATDHWRAWEWKTVEGIDTVKLSRAEVQVLGNALERHGQHVHIRYALNMRDLEWSEIDEETCVNCKAVMH